jgi:hypothetical protein
LNDAFVIRLRGFGENNVLISWTRYNDGYAWLESMVVTTDRTMGSTAKLLMDRREDLLLRGFIFFGLPAHMPSIVFVVLSFVL